jgi:hypothetical protein
VQDRSLTAIDVEWLVSKDIKHVVDIEQTRLFDPWIESDIRSRVATQATVAVVARDRDGDIAGWCLYSAEPHGYLIIRLSVCIWRQRRGVASAILDYIRERMEASQTRFWVRCCVPEHLIEVGCVLLRTNGYISRSMFTDGGGPDHWQRPHAGVEMILRKGW